jgi:hypothetical protein
VAGPLFGGPAEKGRLINVEVNLPIINIYKIIYTSFELRRQGITNVFAIITKGRIS